MIPYDMLENSKFVEPPNVPFPLLLRKWKLQRPVFGSIGFTAVAVLNLAVRILGPKAMVIW